MGAVLRDAARVSPSELKQGNASPIPAARRNFRLVMAKLLLLVM